MHFVQSNSLVFKDDMEFYHEQTGLAVGKARLVESIKNNICGKVTRELVPGPCSFTHWLTTVQSSVREA